jgi:hypothetical protein
MSTEQYPKDKETSWLNGSVVYEDSEGYYFNKEVTVEKWNPYLRQYEKSGTRTEKVRPSSLELLKRAEQNIFIEKRVQSNENLSDEDVYFSCVLVWEYPKEERFKPFFFRVSKRSGEVFTVQLDSGVTSSADINGEFVKRTKIHKLEPDSRIPKNAPVFLLNPSTNELERKLPEPL